MQIYVKTLTGRKQAFDFEPSSTIVQIKEVRAVLSQGAGQGLQCAARPRTCRPCKRKKESTCDRFA